MIRFSLAKTAAWSVHLFTASGLVAGFLAILAISAHEWRIAMGWLFVSLFIDGVDGTLARLCHVKEVLPHIDGKTMDYVIDFATYAIIPAYFFYEAPLVSGHWKLTGAVIMLLVSAVYYAKEGMVSNDYYFVGFPVLWNLVVFFQVFIFQMPEWGNFLVTVAFAILHFVPIKFLYPSQARQFKRLTLFVSTIYLVSMVLILFYYPRRIIVLNWLAIGSGIYFGGMAIYNTWLSPSSK